MPYLYRGEEFAFTQPDGTEIRLRCWGDQHHAVFETPDGFTVVRNPTTGYYEYGVLSDDQTELLPTGARADRADARPPDLPRSLRITREAAKAKAFGAYGAPGRKRRWEERLERRRQMWRAALASAIPYAPPTHETTGDYVGLCLLIDFPDVPAQIPQNEVLDFCNTQGYSGSGNNGSVYDYFLDMSNGRLKYTNAVTAYYPAAHPRAYYTDESVPQPTRARELIREALAHLIAQGYDFDQLSADYGGYVYALNVYYAGPRVNNWARGLWPHSYHLGEPFELAPGRLAFDYQITDMGNELALATFCHENGHMICDFPDLYDYGYQSGGAGIYCLMCWGGPDRKNPTQVCAYLKYKAGWAGSVTSIASGMEAVISADQDDFFIYAKDPREYFIIENRQASGRDASLPCSGLAIWHADEEGSNNREQMTSLLHYECALEQADGQFDLERTISNAGDEDDLFSASTKDEFGDATTPNSRWWDGSPSGLEIRDISAAGETMTFSTPPDRQDGWVEATSSPEAAIPDNDSTGVRNVITLDEQASVEYLEVALDITHTYRGDLRVTLTAPSGAAVVLHDRRGGSADDLKSTFDATTTPGLQLMVGQSVKGDWALHVQDLAAIDTGTLNHWHLKIRRAADSSVQLEDSPGLSIPDDDPSGIERVLSTDVSGQVREVSVSLDITHTFVGDLVVALASPAGTSVDLHRRSGGWTDNIIQTYTMATTPALESLRGEPVQGDWTLKVADLEGQDLGKLNHWALKIVRET